ncbi:MAG TPA: glycosyltransferase family 39 protein [Actinomycetota bacterium]|nr:glycosyltransferase family 39 protein [Actinomycetota bacterium]
MAEAAEVAEPAQDRPDARVVRAVAPAFLLFGLVARLWMLVKPMGGLDADEAIVGLMARHILDGEFPMFYWGQTHGGPHEPLLTAAFFRVFGSSTLILKGVAMLLAVSACVLIWRVGKRTVGEPAATVAGLLFWVWPAAFVWWSVKSRGFYHAGLVIGLGILLLVLRLDERDSALDMAGLGALVATGFWASPQTVFFTIPALGWLAFRMLWKRRFSLLVHVPSAVCGALLGAFPWWVHNIQNDWIALKASPASIAMPAYGNHLRGFFVQGLPGALGLKLADGSRWMAGFFGRAWYFVLLALFVWALVKLRDRTWLLLVMALLYPFLLALSPFSWFLDHPRYLYFLAPVLALLIARGLTALRWVGAVAGLVAAMVLTTSALATMNRDGVFYPSAEGVVIPEDLDPVFDYMLARGIDHVWADYWLAYVIAFESDERITATPYRGAIRNGAADAAVRNIPDPAYMFLFGSVTEPVFEREMAARGVDYERHEVGGFVIYHLPTNIGPEAIPAVPAAQP